MGNWVAVWGSGDSLGDTSGMDHDILVARSTDGGQTWTDPAPLNTNAGSDSGWDSSPQVTTDGLRNWVAVWQTDDSLGGTIGEDWDILVARSTDNGQTWTDPAPFNTNAGSDSGWDNSPKVTADGMGNWVAVWGSGDSLGATIGTDGDIAFATSGRYPTLLASDGARHAILAGFCLGTIIDGEVDGQPTAGADGDDAAGLADEEGVFLSGALVPG